MNTYADDLAALTEALDLKDAIHVGPSTGGGEVARYFGRHGTKRVAKAVLIGAVPPLMLKTPANPGGLPMEVFDQIRAGVQADRAQFFKDLTAPFHGANRPGGKVSQGLRDSFWLQGMTAGRKAVYDRVKAFDFTQDLKKIDVPTLILDGDDDQIVPMANSALLSAKLVKGSSLQVIPGAPHGMCSTLKDQSNSELLAFSGVPAKPSHKIPYRKRRSPMVKKQIDPKTTESGSAQPRFHQRAAELQAYGTVSHALPLELEEPVRLEMTEQLNQLLADTMTLRDLYKKSHWQVAGPTFYQLHLLYDKHHDDQDELVDSIAERIQLLGGVSIAMAADVAETTQIERPPRGREEVPVQLSRLLDAHQVIIRTARTLARRASALGDDGTNDLVISEVLRTNELQVWFLSEHLVNVPLVEVTKAASAGGA